MAKKSKLNFSRDVATRDLIIVFVFSSDNATNEDYCTRTVVSGVADVSTFPSVIALKFYIYCILYFLEKWYFIKTTYPLTTVRFA
jgi:hypothetical protein